MQHANGKVGSSRETDGWWEKDKMLKGLFQTPSTHCTAPPRGWGATSVPLSFTHSHSILMFKSRVTIANEQLVRYTWSWVGSGGPLHLTRTGCRESHRLNSSSCHVRLPSLEALKHLSFIYPLPCCFLANQYLHISSESFLSTEERQMIEILLSPCRHDVICSTLGNE